MIVKKLTEQEDGSAIIEFDMTIEEKEMLISFALNEAIKNAIALKQEQK